MAEKLATLSFSDGSPSIDFPVLAGTMRVVVTDTGHRVRVRMLPGQEIIHFEHAEPVLAHTLGASACHVREDRRSGYVWLDLEAYS